MLSELLVTYACMLYVCYLCFSAARGSSEEGDPQESLQVDTSCSPWKKHDISKWQYAYKHLLI